MSDFVRLLLLLALAGAALTVLGAAAMHQPTLAAIAAMRSTVIPVAGLVRNLNTLLGPVLTLCQDLGIPVREQSIPREMLYIADEVFLTGTAAEITPLRSVDRITLGAGHRGPITKRLQEEFFAIVSGAKPDRHNWLTPVASPVVAGAR